MNKSFLSLIEKHHVLTMCVSVDNKPYCASCFYVFDDKKLEFIIAGSDETKHIKMAMANKHIAGNIALETKNIGLIQGIQFTGVFQKSTLNSKQKYLRKFPQALALNSKIWCLRVNWAKLTNNKLGFGSKLEFTRQ